MGNKVLSERLQEAGFRCVHGGDEIRCDTAHRIKAGVPQTWGRNNGTIAVYDERGFAWVAPCGGPFIEATIQIIHDGLLDAAPHIPHSNDGGDAMRRMFPDYPLRKRGY